jgi:putative photosynthetic complex assembly protein 2
VVTEHLLPLLYTLFVWWFSTGAILYLDGLPRWTFKLSMGAATGVLAVALTGLAYTRDDVRPSAAYIAFTCAVAVWGWQEIAFLFGYVTGPRRTAMPAGAQGWARWRYGIEAVLYHELVLIVLAAAVLLATWGGQNMTGLWTYAILWVMRQSAKLNLFLGVRNMSESLLPPHLAYIGSYFRRRTMNGLFPLSVILSTVLCVLVWQAALSDLASPYAAVSLTFLAAMLTLAVLEHLFLMLPIPAETLFTWGLKSRTAQ